MATLPGVWHDRVSVRTGWPGVTLPWLGETVSSIYNVCLNVAAQQLSMQLRPWDTPEYCRDAKQPTNRTRESTPLWLPAPLPHTTTTIAAASAAAAAAAAAVAAAVAAPAATTASTATAAVISNGVAISKYSSWWQCGRRWWVQFRWFWQWQWHRYKDVDDDDDKDFDFIVCRVKYYQHCDTLYFTLKVWYGTVRYCIV